jgi:hypothetical protein
MDRGGHPTINPFINPDGEKNLYNTRQPARQRQVVGKRTGRSSGKRTRRFRSCSHLGIPFAGRLRIS